MWIQALYHLWMQNWLFYSVLLSMVHLYTCVGIHRSINRLLKKKQGQINQFCSYLLITFLLSSSKMGDWLFTKVIYGFANSERSRWELQHKENLCYWRRHRFIGTDVLPCKVWPIWHHLQSQKKEYFSKWTESVEYKSPKTKLGLNLSNNILKGAILGYNTTLHVFAVGKGMRIIKQKWIIRKLWNLLRMTFSRQI